MQKENVEKCSYFVGFLVKTHIMFYELIIRYFFFFYGVPQRLDAEDLGRSSRCYTLVNIYHIWDRGTAHRASFVPLPA